jgi:hypothetical protein
VMARVWRDLLACVNNIGRAAFLVCAGHTCTTIL